MRDSTLESTLDYKGTYEKICDTNGVQVKCYHKDNRQFTDPAFKTAVSEENQKIILLLSSISSSEWNSKEAHQGIDLDHLHNPTSCQASLARDDNNNVVGIFNQSS